MVIIIIVIYLGWLECATLSDLWPPSVAVLLGFSEVKDIGQILPLSWEVCTYRQHFVDIIRVLARDSPMAL